MPNPKTLLRSVRVVEHLLTGACISLYVAAARALGARPRWVPAVVRWWHGRLCRALGLTVEVDGEMVHGALLVANHVSWLDIPVLGAQARMQFLSKAEVRDWPLVGWMAAVAGTLFIARGANQSGEVVNRIGVRVHAGPPVVIFPEGTTSDGREVRRFHPRLFAAAQQSGVRVQPVALRYGRAGEPDAVAPFVGDDDLVSHLLRVLSHPDLVVSVRFLPPLAADGADRRRLAEQCRSAITASLEQAGRCEPAPAGGNARGPAVTAGESLGRAAA